jgi:hypothetical protein
VADTFTGGDPDLWMMVVVVDIAAAADEDPDQTRPDNAGDGWIGDEEHVSKSPYPRLNLRRRKSKKNVESSMGEGGIWSVSPGFIPIIR